MKTYVISFEGRLNGAQGVTYRITDKRDAETPEKAIAALYDAYEMVSPHSINESMGGRLTRTWRGVRHCDYSREWGAENNQEIPRGSFEAGKLFICTADYTEEA
jgi:hypothetical protein